MTTGTYHGIIKATCLNCRYSTIDDTTLEVWNDAPMLGFCPNCHGETGQTQWVTLDGHVNVCSFVQGSIVDTTDVTGDAAWWIRSRALCERVAALIPNATTTDDGGGEYVTVDGLPVELFPIAPENATLPEQANRWQFQINELPQTVCETSPTLTIDSDPADVAAWALTLIPQPKPEPHPVIHTLSPGVVDRVRTLMTAAIDDGRGVRVAWDGGLKVKVGEGMWSPILSRPEA